MPQVEVLVTGSERNPHDPVGASCDGAARRASNRRVTARNRHGDTEASIIDFLAQHPESTAGDLAKSQAMSQPA